jgi:two-component system chemotaxis response regulator CheY
MTLMTPPGPTIFSLQNFNVLLVEDYEFIQSLVVSMLRAFGVGHVIVCNNGEEAKHLITLNHSGNAKPIDIVLTDWMMPGGMGADLMAFIRNHKNETIRFMPIIMLSTFVNERAVMAARDAGANEVLMKPLSAEKMASRILSVVNHPRPFVKAASFFGPDRRRRAISWKKEERRVMDVDQIREHHETTLA